MYGLYLECNNKYMVKTAIFRDVTPCGLVGAYEHFQGTCCLSHEVA
jgi:hypothetical protein